LSDDRSDYELTDEQKSIVRENTENYLNGIDKGKSWEEIKVKLSLKKNG
jgi:hypothetical protein